MVLTRSKVVAGQQDGSDDPSDDKPSRRLPSQARRRNFVITIAPNTKPRKKNPSKQDAPSDGSGSGRDDDDTGEEVSSTHTGEEDADDDDEYETYDEEEEEDEFDLPSNILEDKTLKKKAESLITYIKQHSPSLETILRSKMRRKHKAELFEWFMIYENSMPMSEERMVLRRQVFQMMEHYQKEYEEYKKHKKEVKVFENNVQAHNDLSDMQYQILRLETSDAQKQVLFRKYSELREKDDLDEEFYKLKGWLKQALQLPYDRIKHFPKFDDMTKQLVHVKRIFDEELYGMERVKEQLLLFIHGKIMNPDMKGCCLGLVGEPGVGKCLHPTTEVLLFDGTFRQAQHLKPGDVLMGDDSTPRTIESLCRGRQLMYKVHQQNGDPYIVNSSHILTLFHVPSGELQDVEISEFVRFSKKQQAGYRGVKTGVEFSTSGCSSTGMCLRWMGRLWSSQVRPNRFLLVGEICEENPVPEYLECIDGGDVYAIRREKYPEMALFFEKHWKRIPSEIRTNDRVTRLQFLRGIIESTGVHYDLHFHLFLRKSLIDDVLFLTRSLGLYSQKTQHRSVNVWDPLQMIKGKIPKERVLVTYDISIQRLDVQEYVGFMIDGNHRFLLKDFTVTHNTSIARCLAKVLGFPFEQISFGGVNHADFIKGFDFTYVGSRPGEIARCLSRMSYKNGIIFFDEYEKIAQNPEITSSLLHITDFSQNNGFRDNYFNELLIDLSSIWFIYSMNELPNDKALRDRVYSIQVEGYSEKEKIRIASDYLFPKNLANIGKKAGDLKTTDEVVRHLVRKVCREEKGIRNLEKAVKDIINKVHFLVTNQETIPCSYMLPPACFPIQFPAELTETMVDVLLKDFHLEEKRPSFYI